MHQVIEIGTLDGLVISIAVLFVGMELTQRVSLLSRFNIPPAVTGGLLFAILISLLRPLVGIQVTFDLHLRWCRLGLSRLRIER